MQLALPLNVPATPYRLADIEAVNAPASNVAALLTVTTPAGRRYARCRLLRLPGGAYTLAGPLLVRHDPASGRTDYKTGLLGLRQEIADHLAADALALLLLAQEGRAA